MNLRPSANWKSLAQDVRALAVGVLVGAVLVTAYTLADAIAAERTAGGSILMRPQAQAQFALMYSLVVAVFLASLCAPVWMLFARFGLDRWYVAGGLGFAAVLAFWTLDNIQGPTALVELIRSGVPYALCGAAAGFAAWWSRQRS
jgi:hypothetical protein